MHTLGLRHRLVSHGKTEVDMTNGNIAVLIFDFALPLLLGNIFQQLYNTVDTWVVGNYVGKNAFSAVGTLNSIINTLIGFFVGFSNGACVIIAQHFGANNPDKIKKAVHTFVSVTLILCVFFTFLGMAFTPMMLKLMKSPPEVFKEQEIYLTIYFAGITGLLLYNMGSAILRAVGNSFYPFLFLVVSAILNIVLDLVFVIVFKLGTAGVAYATILSQMVSAILVVFVLLTTKSCVNVRIRDLRIDMRILKDIFRIGLPSALQMSITAFSNVFVQSYINYFGSDCMGGWTAYSKLDQLLFLPMQSIALAAQTFVGQNLGKNLTERTRKGVSSALFMAVASTAFLVVAVEFFASGLVGFFIDSNEVDVIYYGTLFLRTISPFYILCCVNQVYGGALRGSGNSHVAMIVMLFSFVLFRQIYLFIMSNFISNTVLPIAFSYPAGWLVCSLLMLVFYRRVFSDKNLLKTRLI